VGSKCWFEITLLLLYKNIKSKFCCLEGKT
jgi:hypothetical protein